MSGIRFGIIGTGQIMHDAYLPILPFLDTVEGVTLLDLDPQALDRTLHNFESWLDEGLFQRSYNPFFPSAQERARKFCLNRGLDARQVRRS